MNTFINSDSEQSRYGVSRTDPSSTDLPKPGCVCVCAHVCAGVYSMCKYIYVYMRQAHTDDSGTLLKLNPYADQRADVCIRNEQHVGGRPRAGGQIMDHDDADDAITMILISSVISLFSTDVVP